MAPEDQEDQGAKVAAHPLAHYEKDADGAYIVKLDDPIERKKTPVTAIHIREPRARDIRHLGPNSDTLGAAMLDVAAKCATVNGGDEVATVGIIGALGMEDTGKVLEIIGHFYEPVFRRMSAFS